MRLWQGLGLGQELRQQGRAAYLEYLEEKLLICGGRWFGGRGMTMGMTGMMGLVGVRWERRSWRVEGSRDRGLTEGGCSHGGWSRGVNNDT